VQQDAKLVYRLAPAIEVDEWQRDSSNVRARSAVPGHVALWAIERASIDANVANFIEADAERLFKHQ